MANPEHVEIVKQGTEAIRIWRERNRTTVLELTDADLHGLLNLSGANLRSAVLCGADLGESNLSGADLSEADLEQARMQGANLSLANLSKADLRWAVLVGASLRGAVVSEADLTGTSLHKADLCGAFLGWSNLNGAKVGHANFNGCICGWTVFGDVDLSEVIGLDNVQHDGPSSVSVGTLFKSKGRIPEVFLRGAGVPDVLIQYVGSLTGAALEFYTCFISFTEADDAFSERLHNDLQAAGVRCWRWKENAKWGRTLMREVDEAIRVYDKLVVILSKASLKAEPVIREIDRALQKEQREAKEVLFPIRLDDAVFSWEHALQADVVRKVIGDFREWQNPVKYAAALKRLIADLRAEAKTI